MVDKPIKPKRVLLTDEQKKERQRIRSAHYRETHIDVIKLKAVLYRTIPHCKEVQQICMKKWYENNKAKHINHVLEMQQVNKNKYNCEKCDFHNCNKTKYEQHLKTKKHAKNVNL